MRLAEEAERPADDEDLIKWLKELYILTRFRPDSIIHRWNISLWQVRFFPLFLSPFFGHRGTNMSQIIFIKILFSAVNSMISLAVWEKLQSSDLRLFF